MHCRWGGRARREQGGIGLGCRGWNVGALTREGTFEISVLTHDFLVTVEEKDLPIILSGKVIV